MVDSREKRVDLILQQLDELPTLPSVAVRVLELTSGDGGSLAEVAGLLSSDPALSSRILQLVHRADLGVRGEVNSVERAISLLGFETVRSAVLAISVFGSFAAPATPGQFSREEFWKHCIAVACCAELLAGTMPPGQGIPPSEAFICGLLHDLGKVAMDAVLPKSFGRVVEAAELLRGNIADVERSVVGLDHMVVGKRLAERWNLPATIRDCIWLHGQHPKALPGPASRHRLVNLITLADLLVREQHLGYSGNYSFSIPRSVLIEAAGLGEQQVAAAMGALVTQIEPRAKALGLGQASSAELYQQALAQANRELGRVSGQLASKNRRLGIRAKFFDALSGFQANLRPDAPPQAVLQAIARTAVSLLGVPQAAAFSLPPGQAYAQLILCDAQGQAIQDSLVDLPSDDADGQTDRLVSPPAAGDGPVMPVSADLEWLVSTISPRLDHDQRFWICLETDGVCVGGLLWGGEPGEAQRLAPQVQELAAIANGWSLALRTSQIRDEARALAEQLAEANRQLQNAQAEITRSKMMISIGEMAAGAAHEMNNPLAVISGRSQLLAQQMSDPRHKAMAHLIYEQSHRLSAIITELMDFAKPEPPRPSDVELAEVVERALHEAKSNGNSDDRDFEVTMGDVPPVNVDPKQTSAAVAEIIDNALHATAAGAAGGLPSGAVGRIALHGAYDPYSGRVVLTISDSGCGMDEETVKRAFDPFFSSKPAGRRRGMGLAKALRWIEASGGSIRLESRPGQGTRCVVLLPAAKVTPAPAPVAAVRRAAQ